MAAFCKKTGEEFSEALFYVGKNTFCDETADKECLPSCP
jgi:hypothetical protein